MGDSSPRPFFGGAGMFKKIIGSNKPISRTNYTQHDVLLWKALPANVIVYRLRRDPNHLSKFSVRNFFGFYVFE